MTTMTEQLVDALVAAALVEDVGPGDLTTTALFTEDDRCHGKLLVKQPGVLCGIEIACSAFTALDPGIEIELLAADGDRIENVPHPVARVDGRARAILTAERTALNLLGRLSGISTLTRRYVDACEGTRAVILDTRKTTPGLRAVEKYAVRCGGAANHRLGLYDAILVKDNHLRVAGGVRTAVQRLRANAPQIPIELEVEDLHQVAEALELGVERILLDNMAPPLMAEAVALVDGRALLEASGGVRLDTVHAIAETGVDYISIGALTHSAPALDVSLEVDR